MNRTALYEAIRSIDEAAVGPRPPDQARRLAGIRAQLWLLMREIESSHTPVQTERPTIFEDSARLQQELGTMEYT